MTPDQQKVVDLRKEMKAAQRNSLGVWAATKWLIAFLGASAPITFGLELTGDRELAAFRWLAIAGGAAAVGGFSHGVSITVARSQLARAVTIAAKGWSRFRGQAVTTGFLLVQILCLGTLIGAQVGALKIALTTDNSATTGEQMIQLLEQYRTTTSTGMEEIREFCTRHQTDDGATRAFLAACETFQTKTPTASETDDLIRRLRTVQDGG